jgi:putative membrane protein
LAFWALLVCYAAARVLQAFAGSIPMRVIVILHVLPPALFALFHGSMRYRLRGIVTFVAICLVVGNAFENLSILTGFPFGHYYFTGLMGPRLFRVPSYSGWRMWEWDTWRGRWAV